MRRSKCNDPFPWSLSLTAIYAIVFVVISLSAFGEESVPAHQVESDPSPFYVEPPFRLDDADALGLPLYLRLPSKPPLFYPKAIDVFSWIDLAKPNWRSLQDLIERPDLADEVFPKPVIVETPDALLHLIEAAPDKSVERDYFTFKDPVDRYIARLAQEASVGVDESVLKQRMRVHPLSEEDLLKGIAYLESLRNERKPVSAPLAESPTLPIAKPMPEPAVSSSRQSSPSSVPTPSPPRQPSPSDVEIPESVPSPTVPEIIPSQATLRMAAKVPLPDGTQRPAFASEFFLTTRQLEDLLSEAIPYPTAANDVRQLIRLWAESEKRSGPGGVKLALNVKSVLIKAQVGKVLTDFKGEAQVAGLKPDDYYLIGIDKDDETGIVTIWSKSIAIARGENLVEVSARDVVWSK